MSNSLPENHDLLLSQKIIDFLQEREYYKEYIIDEVIRGYSQDVILTAIEELSIADVVHFSNNNPMNYSAFINPGEVMEPTTVNYPVVANLIEK